MFGKLKKMMKQEIEILSPVAGKAVSLQEVSDPVFQQEIVGKGIAVIPAGGRIVAPADGEVTVMFETGHALSITADSGAEILIHVGLDTVNLKGAHYTPRVKQGDKVKAGDLLLEFDREAIQAEGYDTITPVVICNHELFKGLKTETGKEVSELDVVIRLEK